MPATKQPTIRSKGFPSRATVPVQMTVGLYMELLRLADANRVTVGDLIARICDQYVQGRGETEE